MFIANDLAGNKKSNKPVTKRLHSRPRLSERQKDREAEKSTPRYFCHITRCSHCLVHALRPVGQKPWRWPIPAVPFYERHRRDILVENRPPQKLSLVEAAYPGLTNVEGDRLKELVYSLKNSLSLAESILSRTNNPDEGGSAQARSKRKR